MCNAHKTLVYVIKYSLPGISSGGPLVNTFELPVERAWVRIPDLETKIIYTMQRDQKYRLPSLTFCV